MTIDKIALGFCKNAERGDKDAEDAKVPRRAQKKRIHFFDFFRVLRGTFASSASGSRIQKEPMDWDNLRYFLELARSGTLMSAARRLEVDHTTVARRIQALEKEVGAPLFAREAGGHRLLSLIHI